MKVDVLGVKIDALPKGEVLRLIAERLGRGEQTFIVTPYSESLVAAQSDAEFRTILNSADFALADGVGVLWAARFLTSPPPSPISERKERRGNGLKVFGRLVYSLLAIIFKPSYLYYPIPEKISGAEFVWDLAALAADRNKSIFLLGGFGDTASMAAKKLVENFPNLRIAGTDSGHGGEGTVERVNGSGADFLFVALGPKRQEKWIYENRSKLAPKVLIGLGGTFDYLAGKRPYRPQFWALRGLEWLWRLLTQPWRMARIMRGVFGLIYYTAKNGQKKRAQRN